MQVTLIMYAHINSRAVRLFNIPSDRYDVPQGAYLGPCLFMQIHCCLDVLGVASLF